MDVRVGPAQVEVHAELVGGDDIDRPIAHYLVGQRGTIPIDVVRGHRVHARSLEPGPSTCGSPVRCRDSGPPRSAMSVDVPDATFLSHYHAFRAEHDPDGHCWTFGDRTWTWGQAWDDIRRFAGALQNAPASGAATESRSSTRTTRPF